MKKILTISIAAYNASKYLKKCLASIVICKNLDEIQVLVIDDGSVDNTAGIGHEYEKRYPNSVKVVTKENGGHGSTINTSIMMATGIFFKVVDADDWVESENLDRLVDYLRDSESDLVINPFYYVNPDDDYKKTICISTPGIYENITFEKIANNVNMQMHSLTYKTEILKKMGKKITEKCFYVDQEYNLYPIPYVNQVTVLDYPIYDYLFGTKEQSCNEQVMVKRREQHGNVIFHLVDWYNGLKDISQEKKNLIKRRIESLLLSQYNLYLYLPPNIGKPEFIKFDNWLKTTNIILYKDMLFDFQNADTSRVISFLRKHNYKGYTFLRGIKVYGKIIKDKLQMSN